MMEPKRRKLRAKPGQPLSTRELEVAALVAQGFSNQRIADALDISDRTAKFHVENIVTKYGAKTRTDAAVKYAISKISPHVCSSCGAAVIAQ